MRKLTIIENAFRGTIERQYFTDLWCVHSLKKLGIEISLLLKGNSVLYAVKGQTKSILTIGRLQLDTLPFYENSIKNIMNDNVKVFVYENDIKRLAIDSQQLLPGVNIVKSDQISSFIDSYDQFWLW